jgi:hypothetical protein
MQLQEKGFCSAVLRTDGLRLLCCCLCCWHPPSCFCPSLSLPPGPTQRKRQALCTVKPLSSKGGDRHAQGGQGHRVRVRVTGSGPEGQPRVRVTGSGSGPECQPRVRVRVNPGSGSQGQGQVLRVNPGSGSGSQGQGQGACHAGELDVWHLVFVHQTGVTPGPPPACVM